MMQAYKRMEEKLQNFMEDQNAIESSYKDLKVNLCKSSEYMHLLHCVERLIVKQNGDRVYLAFSSATF
jgi:hypothetical protein